MIVNSLAETPPTITDTMCFTSTTYDNGTLCVPPASVEAYRSAPIWSNFATIKGIFAGDANGDGELTVSDVTVLIDYLLGENSGTCFSANADYNGDGDVTIKDLTDFIDMLLTSNWLPYPI